MLSTGKKHKPSNGLIKSTIEKIDQMILSPENRIFGKKDIDPSKLVYHSEIFDLKEASKRENASKPRSQFMIKT